MSAPSSRPPVPRPATRKATLPPASPAAEVRKGYASEPPVLIRERMPSLELELEDADVLEAQAVAPVRATPPPPPPLRSTIVPKLASAAPMPAIAPMPVPKFEPPPDSQVQVKPRLESMIDPSEALFDGMYELNYADTQWAAARLCAVALGRALGARTVIIHSHDVATRELRVIGVHGDGEFDLLGCGGGSDDDLIASAVICNQKAVTMRFDGELPRVAPRRLGMIAAPRMLVAVPAMAWGRCVAVIEIIDADERLASRVADSAAYVAERLAEFLSERVAA